MTERPSCPWCGERDRVSSNDTGHGAAIGAWYCGRCNVVFAGSLDEWQREHDRRTERRRRLFQDTPGGS